ncbi:hypothetical protein Vadar_019323 [Vaccinium darrowii]|uniref:Uncharacterized protein n=1 Tax=Vaccinium darrowii TaxID=229202 RepID=A0ACB7XSD3_9ERIC|nr:hypothetical protein Vadar_019323 [Vaccinium darrowii]
MGRSKRKTSRNTAAAAAAVAVLPISELPDHIISDILSRLPLNSIFACKRVCKVWRDITLEPYFAKLHLSRSPLSFISYRNGNNNGDNDINSSSQSHFEILQLHDPPVLGRHNPTMKFTTEIYFPHLQIVASCNGSILLSNYLSNYGLVIVCNPLRAQHLILPEPPNLAVKKYAFVRFGFGYTPATDQYKVLRLIITGKPRRLDIEIYTIGIDDEWRSIGDTVQLPSGFISKIIFLNGVLHWLDFEFPRVICYFDIEKEQFGSFPLPFQLENSVLHLGVLHNWLYIIDGRKCWMMKDYGDIGSWILEWVIEPCAHTFKGHVNPLKMLKDGTVLMMFKNSSPRKNATETTLASYNPQTRVLKKIKDRGNLLLGDSVTDVPCFFSPMDALK